MNRKSITADESGSILVLTALCLVVVLAILGLAVDLGHVRYVKRNLQNAADAAATRGGT